MNFFADITILKIVALALVILGAVLTFASKKIAAGIKKPDSYFAFKIAGLACVIVGMILVFFS
ncbi:MAG: hypothetical protein RR504_05925 [Christensenellaceae bacterium]